VRFVLFEIMGLSISAFSHGSRTKDCA